MFLFVLVSIVALSGASAKPQYGGGVGGEGVEGVGGGHQGGNLLSLFTHINNKRNLLSVIYSYNLVLFNFLCDYGS